MVENKGQRGENTKKELHLQEKLHSILAVRLKCMKNLPALAETHSEVLLSEFRLTLDR